MDIKDGLDIEYLGKVNRSQCDNKVEKPETITFPIKKASSDTLNALTELKVAEWIADSITLADAAADQFHSYLVNPELIVESEEDESGYVPKHIFVNAHTNAMFEQSVMQKFDDSTYVRKWNDDKLNHEFQFCNEVAREFKVRVNDIVSPIVDIVFTDDPEAETITPEVLAEHLKTVFSFLNESLVKFLDTTFINHLENQRQIIREERLGDTPDHFGENFSQALEAARNSMESNLPKRDFYLICHPDKKEELSQLYPGKLKIVVAHKDAIEPETSYLIVTRPYSIRSYHFSPMPSIGSNLKVELSEDKNQKPGVNVILSFRQKELRGHMMFFRDVYDIDIRKLSIKPKSAYPIWETPGNESEFQKKTSGWIKIDPDKDEMREKVLDEGEMRKQILEALDKANTGKKE